MQYSAKDTELELENFFKIIEEIKALKTRKAKDYGNSWRVFGLDGLIFQVGSKFVRIWNLTKRGKSPSNESLRDSFVDAAVYCIMAAQMLDEGKTGDAFSEFGSAPDRDVNYGQAEEEDGKDDPVRLTANMGGKKEEGESTRGTNW